MWPARGRTDRSGRLCSECIIERIREKYGEKQRASTIARREAWSERAQESWARDRQRVHRLKEAVKPKEPASSLDPWEVAYQALSELRTIRRVFVRDGRRAANLDRLEVIAEALRRLAYGPDDEPVKPKAEPEQDFAGWDGQWRYIG